MKRKLIVAQMGHEPIIEALDQGPRWSSPAAPAMTVPSPPTPIYRRCRSGIAIHMGKILECGAFSAEPFAWT